MKYLVEDCVHFKSPLKESVLIYAPTPTSSYLIRVEAVGMCQVEQGVWIKVMDEMESSWSPDVLEASVAFIVFFLLLKFYKVST